MAGELADPCHTEPGYVLSERAMLERWLSNRLAGS